LFRENDDRRRKSIADGKVSPRNACGAM